MESPLKLGALPPDPRDLSLFSRQNGRFPLAVFEGGIGCRPLPFRPLNRSLGLLPSVGPMRWDKTLKEPGATMEHRGRR